MAYALLDTHGTIVSVDREWSEAASTAAPFGSDWTVGENYPVRCESWPGLQAPDLVEALRDLVNGLRQRITVPYEYTLGADKRSAEMRLQTMEIRGQRMIHVLHVDRSSPIRVSATSRAAGEARRQTAELMNRRAASLANLGQEIRSPLNEILGMTGLVLDSDLDDDQRACLSRARGSARSLLTLINNILDYSSAESGQLSLAPDVFDLRETLTRVVDSYSSVASEKRLALSFEFDPGIPPKLVGDARRVGGVLRNLVDNAIKFTERGEVTVRAVLDGEQDQGILVRFEIVDSGVGIDPAHHQEIFEPFTQLDGSSTRRHGGTGLGLAIVKSTVELMGGAIEVNSQTGNGSKFSVRLPFAFAQGASRSLVGRRSVKKLLARSAAVNGQVQSQDGLRILVAEDNPVSQRLILSELVNRGHRPQLVEDGRAAADAAVAERFELVLMDLSLPVLDGFSATAVIRQKERGSGNRVPIVGMTDPPAVPDELRFRAAGLDAGLSKPLDGEALEALLARFHAPAKKLKFSQPLPSVEGPLIELQQLLAQAGGDLAGLTELVERFVHSQAALLRPIEVAIAEHDSQELARAAHDLTSTFRTMAAPRARHAAHRLELIGRDGRLAEAPSALAALQHEVHRLEGELQSIVERARG